jgi:catechol 2,3-dioxygenase-like lactoylglutathione lyase family enzyme
MADGTTPIVPETPTEAVTPAGINHLVINVRDIEESHKFWTETLGFKQVGYSKRRNGKMRFYSGDHDGRMNHHDSIVREPEPAQAAGGMGDVRYAGGDQPYRDRVAEPRGLAEAAGVAARERRQV